MPIRFSSIGGGGIPSGSSNDRPENPSIGDQFYNGTLGVLEIYSNAGWVPSTGANDFNVSLTGSETSVTFDRTFFSGSYTIASSTNDTTFDTYLFDDNGDRVGYSATPSITATGDFNKAVIIGGTTGDLLAFSYKVTYESSLVVDNFDVSPYLISSSKVSLPYVNDSTVITGGNFSESVEVYFVGSNGDLASKSIVRNSATEMVVTRPDIMPEEDGPYSIKVVSQGIPSAVGSNRHILSNAISHTVATGGTVSDFGGYRVHTFTGSGTFSALHDISADYMVVAGGGGGGTDMGGGGGAGGYLAGSSMSLSAGNYPIVIGAGGLGALGIYGATSYAQIGITSGNNTSAFSLTSIGGGHASSNHRFDTYPALPAVVGGSGGGASGRENGSKANGTAGQGNAGGGSGGEWYSGGGGGSAAAGTTGQSGQAPNGGAGTLNNIDGNGYYWAAGGGGGGYTQGSGQGGIGGGGGGAGGTSAGAGGGSSINSGQQGYGTGNGPAGGSAGANTGSGGGGGSHQASSRNGNGGSGIVIVRYPVPA